MPRQDKTLAAQKRAKHLRKQMTPSELVLWRHLRGSGLGVRFRRQEPIGPYIVDFVSRKLRLIIEADGDQHEFSKTDARRDGYLRAKGYTVLRFWNEDIALYPDSVIEEIRRAVEERLW